MHMSCDMNTPVQNEGWAQRGHVTWLRSVVCGLTLNLVGSKFSSHVLPIWLLALALEKQEKRSHRPLSCWVPSLVLGWPHAPLEHQKAQTQVSPHAETCQGVWRSPRKKQQAWYKGVDLHVLRERP